MLGGGAVTPTSSDGTLMSVLHAGITSSIAIAADMTGFLICVHLFIKKPGGTVPLNSPPFRQYPMTFLHSSATPMLYDLYATSPSSSPLMYVYHVPYEKYTTLSPSSSAITKAYTYLLTKGLCSCDNGTPIPKVQYILSTLFRSTSKPLE